MLYCVQGSYIDGAKMTLELNILSPSGHPLTLREPISREEIYRIAMDDPFDLMFYQKAFVCDLAQYDLEHHRHHIGDREKLLFSESLPEPILFACKNCYEKLVRSEM